MDMNDATFKALSQEIVDLRRHAKPAPAISSGRPTPEPPTELRKRTQPSKTSLPSALTSKAETKSFDQAARYAKKGEPTKGASSTVHLISAAVSAAQGAAHQHNRSKSSAIGVWTSAGLHNSNNSI